MDAKNPPQSSQSTPQGDSSEAPATTPIAAKQPRYQNVLVVEDEHFIGELYTRALTKAGYNVKVVIDGQEGLKEAQTNTYDIILLDLMIPNLTGTELLKSLRDPKITPHLKSKIIITTNLEQADEAKEEIEKQADGYVVKAEVTPKQLVAFLQSFEQ